MLELATRPDTLLWTALIVLVGKIVFDWLKGRKNGDALPHKCEKCLSKIDELHVVVRDLMTLNKALEKMHDVKNPDGSYAWYTPKQTIEEVREEARITNNLLIQIVAELKILHESIITFVRKT